MKSLVSLLRDRADGRPDAWVYAMLADGERETGRMTLASLDARARAIGAVLQGGGATGNTVLLLYPPGLEFLAGFWGCLYAGAIAVPAPLPDNRRPARALARLDSIVRDAQPRWALSQRSSEGALRRLADDRQLFGCFQLILTDEIGAEQAGVWRDPSLRSDSVAYLQYTSGSTGKPKGVMVTHGNVLANCAFIGHVADFSPASRHVNWVPTFHDQGLVYGVLNPVYGGYLSVHLPPTAFIESPSRWLNAVSRYGATHAGGPHFCYELCLRRIPLEERGSFRLDEWRNAYSAGEPVRYETFASFASAFAESGFRSAALQACYGLAEATLRVAGARRDTPFVYAHFDSAALERGRAVESPSHTGARSTTLVAHGPLRAPQREIRVVDPVTLEPCGQGVVGEIWVNGPDVAAGYWLRPAESDETFSARLEGSQQRFLRTGDLGFEMNGELYLLSRLKDIIIVRGANHYPGDIEHTVERSSSRIRPGRAAAFGVEVDGEERVVVAAELADSPSPVQPPTNRDQSDSGLATDEEHICDEIRRSVQQDHELAVYEIALVPAGSLPTTSSGKLQRAECRQQWLSATLAVVGRSRRIPGSLDLSASPAHAPLSTRDCVRATIARHVGLPPAHIDAHRPFFEYGLDSLGAVTLVADVANQLARAIPTTAAWDYPTLDSFCQYLDGVPAPAQASATTSAPVESEGIAIVGMACRFPGADDLRAYWQLLTDAVDAVTEVPPERWDADSVYVATPTPGKSTSRWGGFLRGVDTFDRELFQVSPDAAVHTDPQQRILLETAWEALEDANVPVSDLGGSATGVFVGITQFDYGRLSIAQARLASPYSAPGASQALAANRISYSFDLRGPSLSIDTACSSSLVALHYACESLRNGESELALVGGVNLMLTPDKTIALSQGTFLSPDGRCKTFDASANGYVRGEGVGVVVLKRCDQLVGGDRVYAVIRGTAVNQDGRTNGLTAPNGLAQQRVILQALKRAGLTPADIGYIEAHGTGTALGDPIEVGALTAVLSQRPDRPQPCAVGSVKSNIGHLEAAAGIAGLIKAALCLHHRTLVPSLHFTRPNPHITLEPGLIAVQTRTEPWPDDLPPAAGVSSFGFGGTNAHAVLQQRPVRSADPEQTGDTSQKTGDRHLLVMSAASEAAARALAHKYAVMLDGGDSRLGDVCAAAALHRSHLNYRVAVVGSSARELTERLDAFHATVTGHETVVSGEVAHDFSPRVAFLFPGQGDQYAGMASELYKTNTTFRLAIDRCAHLLRDELPRDLRTVMFEGRDSEIDQTRYTQPALFSLGYALSQMWQSWGVTPEFVLGHSLGELNAACAAGVFSIEDGVRLSAIRGRLTQQLPRPGAMVAAAVGVERCLTLLEPFGGDVSIATVNGPSNVVLSATERRLDELFALFDSELIKHRRLNIAYASHSPAVEPMLAPFAIEASRVRFSKPRLQIVSNLTGGFTSEPGVDTADYWVRQVREPVLFWQSTRTLFAAGCNVVIEMGPQPTLIRLIELQSEMPQALLLPSMRHDRSDWEQLLESVSHLFVRGHKIDWRAFHGERRFRRVSLPSYPFQRQRYWIDQERATASSVEPEEYLWSLSWREESGDEARSAIDRPRHWLILADRSVGPELARRLKGRGDRCTVLLQPAMPEAGRPDDYAPDVGREVEAALGNISSDVELHIVDLRTLDSGESSADSSARDVLPQLAEMECLRLLKLLQAVAGHRANVANVWLVTCGAQAIDVAPRLHLSAALGLARVATRELSPVGFKMVDLDPVSVSAQVTALTTELLRADSPAAIRQVAYRRGRRLTLHVTPLPVANAPARALAVSADASYLITGGFGSLGLSVASSLVSGGARHLMLIGRRSPAGPVLAWLREMELKGIEVGTHCVDVSKPDELASVLAQMSRPLKGIFHCAGVLADAAIEKQDAKSLAAVMTAKVAGTWNLHTQTLEHELEYFVLFSSISAIVGTPGQANYAAANAFMDAVAHHRRAHGLRALTINWGAWSKIGMAARVGADKHRRGIEPEVGVQIFESLMARPPLAQVLVTGDWAAYSRGSNDRLPVRISTLAQAASSSRPVPPPEGAAPANLADTLLAIVRQVLGRRTVSSVESLVALGVDSLMVIEIMMAARKAGIQLSPGMLAEHRSISEVAQLASKRARKISTAVAASMSASTINVPSTPTSIDSNDDVPLLPMQRLYLENPRGDELTLAPRFFEVPASLEPEDVELALQRLAAHHDALRSRFRRGDDDWHLAIESPTEVEQSQLLRWFDVSELPEEEQNRGSAQALAEVVHDIRMEQGPLWQVALIERGRDRTRTLVLVVHHLISDQMSQLILTQDLLTACGQAMRGEDIELPRKTSGVKAWGEALANLAQSGLWQSEAEVLVAESRRRLSGPLAIRPASVATVVPITLGKHESAMFRERCAMTFGVSIDAAIAAVVSQALATWTAEPSVAFRWISRGRDHVPTGVDLSRTVGCLYCEWPHVVEVPSGARCADVIPAIVACRQRAPMGGLSYSYFTKGPPTCRIPQLRSHPAQAVAVNYLGDQNRLHELATSGDFHRLLGSSTAGDVQVREEFGAVVGASRRERGQQATSLTITLWFIEESLRGEFRYSNSDSLAAVELARLFVDGFRVFAQGDAT